MRSEPDNGTTPAKPDVQLTPIGLSPRDAAAALSISRRMLSTLMANRDSGLPFVRLGGRIIFPRDRLQAWLEAQIVRPR